MARINEEKEHYRSLTNLFKFALGLFSAFGIAIGFIVYSDGKEMRQELRERRIGLEASFNVMKSDLNIQKKEHEEELLRQKSEMQKDRENLTQRFKDEINWTENQAINEIKNIKSSSKEIAQLEAKSKINEVFDNKNFDDFVAKIAKERIEPQLQNLVDEKVKKTAQVRVESAITDIESSEPLKVSLGYAYIIQDRYLKLDDEQVKRIIAALNNDNYRQMLGNILVFQNNPSVIDFFRSELQRTVSDPHLKSITIQFFVLNNADFEFLNAYITTNPADFETIISAHSINPSYITKFLNSKTVVDKLISTLSKEQFTELKKRTMENIRGNTKIDYTSTYFFSK